MKKNLTKLNSSYRYGCYHVGRSTLWGWYCPETGEYYLAHDAGEYIEVLASACYQQDDVVESWQDISVAGFEVYWGGYDVVRELLQLGHLTKKTLKTFIAAGGDVWWDQPNYSKER